MTAVAVIGFTCGRLVPRAVHRAAGRDRRVRPLPDRASPGAGRHGPAGHIRAAIAGQRAAARRHRRLLPRRAGPADRAGHVHGRDRGRAARRARPGAGAAPAGIGRRPDVAARRSRRRDGWLLRAAAVILVACGVAASCDRVRAGRDREAGRGLAGGRSRRCTRRPATSRYLSRRTARSASGFKVCVHPAFSFYLDDLAAALGPVAAEIAGLPGAPAGAKEVASMSGGQSVMSGISGNPPVFEFTAEHVGTMFGEFCGIPDPAGWRAGFQQGLLDAFLTGPSPSAGPAPAPLDAAQQAVENALLAAGSARSRCRILGKDAGRRRRPPPRSGSPRCPPARGTPGSRRTWPPCGPARSPWRRSRDRRRGTEAAGRPGRGGPRGPRPASGWPGCTCAAAASRPGSSRSPCAAPCCTRRCTGTGRSTRAPTRSRSR